MPSYYVTYGGDRVTFHGVSGPVSWEYPVVMVIIDPLRTGINRDYFKVSFLTPDGDEIVIQDGDGTAVSASAYVPPNSTAMWTAHGYEGNETAKFIVSSVSHPGFSGWSADTAVTTAICESPYATAYGSAVVTAEKSASLHANTFAMRRATFGEGSTYFGIALSASSFLGDYVSPISTAKRTAWLPHGSNVRFSASSVDTETYSISSATVTSMDNFDIVWDHAGNGTNMDATGTQNKAIDYHLSNGRAKRVYASGYNRVIPTTATASAAVWQPYNIITAFSSNLCKNSGSNSFITGSANIGKVNGFSAADYILGSYRNSAGTWSSLTWAHSAYKWNNRQFYSNSAYVSATYSAFRKSGPNGSNNANYGVYGKDSAGNSVLQWSASFAVPTVSGQTATATTSWASSNSIAGSQVLYCLHVGVALSTALGCNCVGYWTASGIVK